MSPDSLLDEIRRALMQSPGDGQVDVLRLVIGAIAMRVREEPDWLLSLPPEDQHLFEQMMIIGILAPGPNDGSRH
jgi:hypothetical protein